ncbi:unnamed protein product [Caenorhabditis sp. 36 PRJEB53466]|nr:unnamed protein product [Caenorhabditis sp. 36 PRJEB53466]
MFLESVHPLVMTLVIYAMADVAFASAIGFSALNSMWSNPYFPLVNSGVLLVSIMSVYMIAYSHINLAIVFHGILKLLLAVSSLHAVFQPAAYEIEKQEAVALCLYYIPTITFEMTAFFVINKMNIPFYLEEEFDREDEDSEEEDDDLKKSRC